MTGATHICKVIAFRGVKFSYLPQTQSIYHTSSDFQRHRMELDAYLPFGSLKSN